MRVKVTNQGKRPARELVQLYVQDVAASVTQPIRELKAYKHVELAPGQSKVVDLPLAATELAFLDRDMKWRPGEGRFKIWVAPSAETEGLTATFDAVA